MNLRDLLALLRGHLAQVHQLVIVQPRLLPFPPLPMLVNQWSRQEQRRLDSLFLIHMDIPMRIETKAQTQIDSWFTGRIHY
jgi:hypothetical protein